MFRRLDRLDYVRIVMKAKRKFDPVLRQMINQDHTHHYVEHLTLGLISYSYWGHVIYEADR